MPKQTSLVIMPLFIDRLREFSTSPTIKTWGGAVSGIVKNPRIRGVVSYGRRGVLASVNV